MGEVINKIGSFLAASNVNIALKIIAAILVIVAGLLYLRYKQKLEIEAARKKESEQEVKDRQGLVGENKKETKEVQSDSDKIDDYLKTGGDKK